MQIYAVNYFSLNRILAKRFQICNGDIRLHKVFRGSERRHYSGLLFFLFLFHLHHLHEMNLHSPHFTTPNMGNVVVCV